MENYDSRSCNTLEKLYYRPIEAALRWCNLISFENQVLVEVGKELLPPIGAFPQWPCLRLNTEKICTAIRDGELLYGRDGKTVVKGETVRKDRITVKHTDLRNWIQKTYPDQKPQFLFDEIERSTHSSINADTFRTLQADRDALKARVGKAEEWAKAMIAEKKILQDLIASLTAQVKEADPIDTRERNTLLSIIGVLCKEAKIDYIKPAKAARFIQGTAALMQVSIGETTIEGHLKKIPDALETRMK
jgi:hypothetical protein